MADDAPVYGKCSECVSCLEKASQLDNIQTLVVNLTTTVEGMHETMVSMVEGLNAVGTQNNWIVENAGRVFTAFEQMREQISRGGLMSVIKGVTSNGG